MPGENIQDWSVTATLNGSADSSINFAEGQSRASVNNSARSMMAAHAKDRNLHNGSIVTGGTANAHTFFSGLDYTTTPTGLTVLLKIGPSLTNTGAATLNMDNIGAVAVKDMLGVDLVGGELTADTYQEFIYNGTNWILLQNSGGMVLLGTQTAAAVDHVNFTTGISGTYDNYLFLFNQIDFDTTDARLCMRISATGGAPFLSAPNYWYSVITSFSHGAGGGSIFGSGDLGAPWFNSFILTNAVGSGVSTCDGQVMLCATSGAGSNANSARWNTTSITDSSGVGSHAGSGIYVTLATPANAVQFFPDGGTMTGTFRVYGIKKS